MLSRASNAAAGRTKELAEYRVPSRRERSALRDREERAPRVPRTIGARCYKFRKTLRKGAPDSPLFACHRALCGSLGKPGKDRITSRSVSSSPGDACHRRARQGTRIGRMIFLPRHSAHRRQFGKPRNVGIPRFTLDTPDTADTRFDNKAYLGDATAS